MITKMPRLSTRDATSITMLSILTILYAAAWGYLAESEAPKHAWLLFWAPGMLIVAAWIRVTIIIQEVLDSDSTYDSPVSSFRYMTIDPNGRMTRVNEDGTHYVPDSKIPN